MKENPIVFCGRATFKLATAVCKELNTELENIDIEDFSDEEPWYRVLNREKIKKQTVFIIQSTSQKAPITYFDLFGIMDAVRRQNPKKLVVIMPFMGFRRQERDKDGGEAVMAELMAQIIVKAGATDVVLVDPHAPEQMKRFFAEINLQIIDANPVFAEIIAKEEWADCVVITPDDGRKHTTSCFAEMLGLPLTEASKSRSEHDEATSEGIKGDVKNKIVIIREDEISTGGTIIGTVKELIKNGAREIIIMATHGVLTGGAVQKLKRIKEISQIYITDSVYLPWEKRIDKIKILSLAPLLAKTIKEIGSE